METNINEPVIANMYGEFFGNTCCLNMYLTVFLLLFPFLFFVSNMLQ